MNYIKFLLEKSLKKLILKRKLEWLCLFEWILSEKQKRCKKNEEIWIWLQVRFDREAEYHYVPPYMCAMSTLLHYSLNVCLSLYYEWFPRWNFLSIFHWAELRFIQTIIRSYSNEESAIRWPLTLSKTPLDLVDNVCAYDYLKGQKFQNYSSRRLPSSRWMNKINLWINNASFSLSFHDLLV